MELTRPEQLDPDRLLDVQTFARRWDMSRSMVYKLIAAGLPSVKVGRSRRIRVSDADAWLESQQGAA